MNHTASLLRFSRDSSSQTAGNWLSELIAALPVVIIARALLQR